jgi:hypothetical protein
MLREYRDPNTATLDAIDVYYDIRVIDQELRETPDTLSYPE